MSRMKRGMIVAVSPEGVIGLNGAIPWHYRGDMVRFKRITLGSTVVMGRLTWESLPRKPLPGRRNIVVTSRPLDAGAQSSHASHANVADDVQTFGDVESALAQATTPVWVIGGARVYADAMAYCDLLDVTYVPDHVVHPDAIRFPRIDPAVWRAGPRVVHEDDPSLTRQEFVRIGDV